MLASSGLDVPFLLAPVVAVAVAISVVWVAVTVVCKSTVVSVPGISLGISSGGRRGLSVGRSLAVVAIVGVAAIVATVVVMSKTVVASIKKIRISLWIGNCLCFSFRLAHGEDGQAEKSQNPDHPADAEVGWKCDEFLSGCS